MQRDHATRLEAVLYALGCSTQNLQTWLDIVQLEALSIQTAEVKKSPVDCQAHCHQNLTLILQRLCLQ